MLAAFAAFFLPVLVDGDGPYRFLIDTGAQSSVIFPGRGPIVRPKFRTVVETVNGEQIVAGGYVGIEVGAARLQHVEVLLYSLPIGDADGVLGQSALRLLDYTIGDYSGAAPTLELKYRDGRILVPATLNGKPATFLLDSGASDLILFRPLVSTNGTALLKTASGQTEVRVGRVAELRIAGFTRRNLRAAIVMAAPERGVDGLLPASLFRGIRVANSTGKLGLE